MAFPSGPSNGQVANVGGITYIYNSTKGAWVRTPSTGANLIANSLAITSGATSTSTTTGALIVTGGVGVGGTVTATTLVGSISSSQVTTALGYTPYNSTNPNGYISSVPNASTQVSSLGVGTAASGTTGEIRATNNITAYYASDVKFKENIAPIESAVDKIIAIGGKTFDWTDDYITAHGGTDDYFLRKKDFGVIAQDVESAFPLAVRTRPDGSLAVDYEKLCALAFQAIVELKSEIDALKSK
jgi:hypothetical protein